MSSFKRRAPARQLALSGTRHSTFNSALLMSVGIASLDDILGGGLPLGSLLLVEEDDQSTYAQLLLKFWIAQGLCCRDHQVLVAGSTDSAGGGPDELIRNLMAPEDGFKSTAEDDEPELMSNEKSMKIAFRYELMQKHDSTAPLPRSTSSVDSSIYCSIFDLTKTYKLTPAEENRIRTVPISPFESANELLTESILLAFDEMAISVKSGSPLRIAIQSLASPGWGELSPSIIIRFLLALRHRLRRSSASAIVTFPAHQFRSIPGGEKFVRQIEWSCDGVIEFASFAGSARLTAAYPRYSGLLHVHSLPALETLVPPSTRLSVLRGLSAASSASSNVGGGTGSNLAFRLKRKRLVIETLHLDIEGGVSERQIPNQVEKISHDHDDEPVRPSKVRFAPAEPIIKSDRPELYEF